MTRRQPRLNGTDTRFPYTSLFRSTTAKWVAERSDRPELAQLSAMLERAAGAIALLHGPTHVFDFANRAYLDLIGRDDIVGRSVAEVDRKSTRLNYSH